GLELRVDGARVVITAAGSGIGRVMAQTFREAGARVFICDVDEAAMRQTEADFGLAGAVICDVAEPDSVDRLFRTAEETLGGLDILINNAGIAGPTLPVEEIPVEDWK